MKQCKKCGNCCSNILMVSSNEIDTIKKYIKKHNISPINRQSIFTEYIDICPFLKKENGETKCLIYDVRPNICKRYQCYEEPKYDLDYRNLKAINMLKTFYPNEFCQEVDLTELNNRIKRNQKIIYGK